MLINEDKSPYTMDWNHRVCKRQSERERERGRQGDNAVVRQPVGPRFVLLRGILVQKLDKALHLNHTFLFSCELVQGGENGC